MKVSLIGIVDSAYGLGQGEGIPWSFVAYEEYFTQLVAGHPVLMGRKTFESRGPISGSPTMVLTKNPTYHTPKRGVRVATDLHLAIERCAWLDPSEDIEVFVVGGAELFEQCLATRVVRRIYLTHILGEPYNCDVFFQNQYLSQGFTELYRTMCYSQQGDPQRLEYAVYNQVSGSQDRDRKPSQ